MNSNSKYHLVRTGMTGLLFLSSALLTSANSIITFQVDMSVARANGDFNPGTQTVAARGSFNNSAALALTNNPAGTNPDLYTGTFDATDNGKVMSYKYSMEPGAHYESVALGGNHSRLITLPSTSGSSVSTPVAYFGDLPPDNTQSVLVTFQVNLAQQINTGAFDPSSSIAYTRGSFSSWGTDFPMTNDPSILTTNQFGLVNSNVYVTTYELTGSPGETVEFKFFIDKGSNWESPGAGVGDPVDNNNRFFNLGSSPQTLPIIYFNDLPYAPTVTDDVTFQVDMSAQILAGRFDPAQSVVDVRGNFNSWTTGVNVCTNDPNASNTNLYRTVVTLKDGVGATEQYKFGFGGDWEQPGPQTLTIGGNRYLVLLNTNSQILPVVFYSDLSPSDFVPAETLVTFRVDMSNAVATDGHVFDATADHVFINGIPSFIGWDATTLAAFELTNNPVGSKVYSIQLVIPQLNPVTLTYKYSINGADNEAVAENNHIRLVRSTGAYTMPMDTFGTQLTEPSFGDLKASPGSAGSVLISWLGRPGVHLQTKDNLGAGQWLDQLATDGLSSTNWPIASGALFFRLVQPGP